MSIKIGDYAKTPTGRLVHVIKVMNDGRFECIYIGAEGESVVLEAKLLSKSEPDSAAK